MIKNCVQTKWPKAADNLIPFEMHDTNVVYVF